MHRGRVGTRRFPSAHVRTIFCVWWRHLACASAVAAGAGPQSGWRQPSGITCHPSTLQSALLEARSSPVSQSKSSLSGSHERLLRRLPLNSNHLHLPNYNATAENPAITFPFRLHMVGCIWWVALSYLEHPPSSFVCSYGGGSARGGEDSSVGGCVGGGIGGVGDYVSGGCWWWCCIFNPRPSSRLLWPASPDSLLRPMLDPG